MGSTLSSAAATLALACAACEAFLVPGSPSLGGTSIRSLREVKLGVAVSPDADTDAIGEPLGSYPGPMIPRVGGAMPDQRPGWFRVPAPGGKDSKVGCISL